MLMLQFVVAAIGAIRFRRRCPLGSPLCKYLIVHVQVEPPSRGVQLDLVAILNETKVATHRRLRAAVQNDRAKGSSRHSAVTHPYHILHTRTRELFWDCGTVGYYAKRHAM